MTALETAMRLLHPFMPFITEEIWQQLPKPSGAPQSIMITLYPVRDVRFHDDASEASMALVQKIIVAVRSIRTETNIPTSARLTVLLAVTDDYKKTILEGYKTHHRRAGALQRGARAPQRRQLLGRVRAQTRRRWRWPGDVEVMVPLEGLVDAEGRARQAREGAAKLDKDSPTSREARRPELHRRARRPRSLDKDKAQAGRARGGAREAADRDRPA